MILILMTKILIMIGMIIMVIVMIVTNMLQDHIMFTMGDDFQYQNAVMNYKNMDKVLLLITISSSMKRAMDICEILGQHTQIGSLGLFSLHQNELARQHLECCDKKCHRQPDAVPNNLSDV